MLGIMIASMWLLSLHDYVAWNDFDETILGFSFWINLLLFLCSARDVTVGDELTIVRTYSTRAEYFGRYNHRDYPQPRTAVNMDFARDLNAKTHYGQRTMGAVLLGCKGNPSCL